MADMLGDNIHAQLLILCNLIDANMPLLPRSARLIN